MNNLKKHNFLPQDQLNLAYSHEVIELNRYQRLSLSYLPFDQSVSRLMNAMAMECEHRLHNLQEVAKRMELDTCVDAGALMEPNFLNMNNDHFFVVDESMSRKTLVSAEESAKLSCVFFSWLLETNATPELHQSFFNFLKQKNNEYQVLYECGEQWGIVFPKTRLAM
ncbi:hypothetical protein HVA01_04630 [Halovibrio variabilis]|uniref:Uncharacterized protein n=1 Tax=Halovibrio variabilis TaxID=31910 RepID=A0A511UJP9_9GAMM|nr:hypothetical protein [Halovibrio variabilis]GEN26817.1 hypothetical protein HVA01_04630 [Halovibrio variabilis]